MRIRAIVAIVDPDAVAKDAIRANDTDASTCRGQGLKRHEELA